MKSWILRLAVMVMAVWFVAGCGHQLPVAPEEALKSKKSVLVITSPDLPAGLDQQLGAALAAWRSADKIAWKWLREKKELDEEAENAIRQTAYDQVVVIGSGLFETALKTAAAFPDVKWSLLQQTPERSPAAVQPRGNTAIWQADAGMYASLWNDWVNQQKLAGAPIVWITSAGQQVPAVWAPSEEAEQVVVYDPAHPDAWFQQLSFQVKQINAKWIVLYTPEAAAELAKIRSLRVPFLDMTASVDYSLNWEPILARLRESVKTDSWKPGAHVYAAGETTARMK